MRKIKVPTVVRENGELKEVMSEELVYEIHELSYLGKMLKCKDSKKRVSGANGIGYTINYLEIPCAFDIETTNIYEKDKNGKIKKSPRPFAFMYHWQFCLDDQVVFGRTWEEFQVLIRTLEQRMNLSKTNRLVVYVHNLFFEWGFAKAFLNYEDGFFREEADPLKIVTKEGIEFRCSYALSNMKLEKFCENEEGVTHFKLSGDDYDYDKIRTANTTLTEYEEGYCYNDVRGLCECIRSRMREDTLATMPMTSTGYVRRDLRKNFKKNKKNRQKFKDCAIDAHLYEMCRDAFRGGNTHANLDASNQLLHDLWGYDITSSYPYSMMLPRFPVTRFHKVTLETFNKYIMTGEKAMLIRCRFKNLKYKNTCGIPYIPFSKLTKWAGKKVIDNGRILKIEFCEMVVTDIDYRIILKDYDKEDISIDEVYMSDYGFLPKEIRETVLEYYIGKTALRGISEKAYEYVKKKNSLNSCYGCCVMRIDQSLITYDPKTGKYKDESKPLEEALKKYYNSRNNFLQYFHGVWITALSREHLQRMLWKVGRNDVVYCDTDSIKGMGNHYEEFEEENKHIIELMEKYGGYAYDQEGKKVYLGVWDCEAGISPYNGKDKDNLYTSFKTLGSKKYVYEQNGEIKSTIAGVSKKVGAEYFKKHGIDAFHPGTKITDSGHLTAYYNDDDIHEIVIKGCKMTTAGNIALINNSYKIGVTEEYSDLLLKGLEKIFDIDYI